MTVNKALERVSVLRPSPFDDEMLVSWLSELEHKIALEVMHEKASAGNEPPDGENVAPVAGPIPPDDWDKPLRAAFPYDNIYELYLVAMIDYGLREIDQYQNSMDVFRVAFDNFCRWYIRENMPPAEAGFRGVI